MSDRDRHEIYVREGDRFTVRAQDGARGAVLGRYEIARFGEHLGCRQIGKPCPKCNGQTVVGTGPRTVEIGGVEKSIIWATCPACGGSGLRAMAGTLAAEVL